MNTNEEKQEKGKNIFKKGGKTPIYIISNQH